MNRLRWRWMVAGVWCGDLSDGCELVTTKLGSNNKVNKGSNNSFKLLHMQHRGRSTHLQESAIRPLSHAQALSRPPRHDGSSIIGSWARELQLTEQTLFCTSQVEQLACFWRWEETWRKLTRTWEEHGTLHTDCNPRSGSNPEAARQQCYPQQGMLMCA